MVYAIRVVGNKQTSEKFIRREMLITEGSILTAEMLEVDRLRLESTSLFNRVTVISAIDQKRAVVMVIVTEPFYIYAYPTGKWEYPYRGEEKTYGFGIQHRNISGYGERVGFELSAGYEKKYSLGYSDPFYRLFGRIGLGGGISHSNTPLDWPGDVNYRQESNGGGVSASYKLNRHYDMNAGVSFTEYRSQAPGFLLNAVDKDQIFSGSFSISGDMRDYRSYPSKGYYLSAMVEGNLLTTGPSDAFFREIVDLRYYQPIHEDMLAAVRLYTMFSHRALPYYKRLSLGTSQVRADYDFGSAGETMGSISLDWRFNLISVRYYNFDYIPYAGEYLRDMKFSLEGLVFGDTGFAHYRDGIPDKWFKAYGFGVHSQLSYIQVGRVTLGWGPHSQLFEPTIILSTGVTF